MTDPTQIMPCPCHSGKCYHDCCFPYHKGEKFGDPLAVMRSRYSAYAIGFPEHIFRTTHPENPAMKKEENAWRKEILEFHRTTKFEDLKILNNEEEGDVAEISFTAVLITPNNGRDTSFTEKSIFKKHNDKWLYQKGEILSSA